jgi:cobalt-precorrin 5A hydrolase/precorrin-3B C17-methyltransferase
MAELAAAIVVLNAQSLAAARRIQHALPGARIHGLAARVGGVDHEIGDFGEAVRALYGEGRPLIVLCAAGIVIRTLAPLLADKRAEPPVLAVAEDGSAVVPLLGATSGANDLARRIAAVFDVAPAITTTGELRFGINLLNPPQGFRLLNPEAGKGFVSDLLSGATVRLAGEAQWLAASKLTFAEDAGHVISIVDAPRAAAANELVYLREAKRGRLAVIGLGPGDKAQATPDVLAELAAAEDIFGYETYTRMAGPFRADQVVHASDNREELQRARAALDCAAKGRRAVLVSSGDPGVFAMAAAVMESLHEAPDPAWADVEVAILPGISAAFATAARAGAPLGHDFAAISLSDNLKPFDVITGRLEAAAKADFVLALYNPISKSRPWQLGEALAVLRKHRAVETPVVIGRDVGRPTESLDVVTLGALTPDMVDSRTTLIVGSSRTVAFPRGGGGSWVYTPRKY